MATEFIQPFANGSPLGKALELCGSRPAFLEPAFGERPGPPGFDFVDGDRGGNFDELAYRGFLTCEAALDADATVRRLALLPPVHEERPTWFPGPDRWM